MQSGGDEFLILKGKKMTEINLYGKKYMGAITIFLEDTIEIDNLSEYRLAQEIANKVFKSSHSLAGLYQELEFTLEKHEEFDENGNFLEHKEAIGTARLKMAEEKSSPSDYHFYFYDTDLYFTEDMELKSQDEALYRVEVNFTI